MQYRQRGVSMIGFMFFAAIVIFVVMLAMKVVPAYIEYFSVKKILATMGQDDSTKAMSNAEIRTSFAKRANVGYVTVVKPEDLNIDRSGGGLSISVDYQYHAPLVANISLVIDFSTSSSPSAVE